jgi:hypothetical protein
MNEERRDRVAARTALYTQLALDSPILMDTGWSPVPGISTQCPRSASAALPPPTVRFTHSHFAFSGRLSTRNAAEAKFLEKVANQSRSTSEDRLGLCAVNPSPAMPVACGTSGGVAWEAVLRRWRREQNERMGGWEKAHVHRHVDCICDIWLADLGGGSAPTHPARSLSSRSPYFPHLARDLPSSSFGRNR